MIVFLLILIFLVLLFGREGFIAIAERVFVLCVFAAIVLGILWALNQ